MFIFWTLLFVLVVTHKTPSPPWRKGIWAMLLWMLGAEIWDHQACTPVFCTTSPTHFVGFWGTGQTYQTVLRAYSWQSLGTIRGAREQSRVSHVVPGSKVGSATYTSAFPLHNSGPLLMLNQFQNTYEYKYYSALLFSCLQQIIEQEAFLSKGPLSFQIIYKFIEYI